MTKRPCSEFYVVDKNGVVVRRRLTIDEATSIYRQFKSEGYVICRLVNSNLCPTQEKELING